MRIQWPLLLIGGLFLVAGHPAAAQDCRFFPADCPVNGAAGYGSPDDSLSRLDNPVLPREVAMENRLRRLATDIVSRIAAKQGWDYVELSEDYCPGNRDARAQVLAYPLRPPHWVVFHYQLVVNRDSLQAWLAWLKEFSQRRMDRTTSEMNELAAHPENAQLNKRAQEEQAAFDTERNRQRIHFREASLLIVEIGFNTDFTRTPNGIATPPVSGTPIWLNNPAPDPIAVDLINRSHTSALLLKGDWHRSGGGYIAAFRGDRASSDEGTVKRIKCDEVQTIGLQLSGNAAAIHQFLALLPAADLDQAMVNR